ncbi:MAG: 3,8-cyclase [Bacillota bacterium]|jgi:cyclic pyranopterin phosphate synthase|nr:3,8-cyclase [Bacillota bacterium]MDK2855400.1 3,8-cyclase [Bacillota bacterium]MDK2924466.1 3,8-cyclase [Bacillota bacterium]
MRDRLGRKIDYLRVSVTDRCNLRCLYCLPPQGVRPKTHEEILRYEEIVRLVEVAVSLGIRRVRLTGGEPLVRLGLTRLVAALAAIPGLHDLSLTTNGTLLAPLAEELKRAGLRRVNISLDTLRPERFRAVTRGGTLADAWAGIEAALAAGLHPVKINTVAMAGVNDDELADLAELTRRFPLHVRFIEVMPLGADLDWAGAHVLPMAAVRAAVEKVGRLEPAQVAGAGPARAWRFPGAPGTVGFIGALSETFCARCNRLRLTADGKLKPCLASDVEVDVRGLLRRGAGNQELEGAFRQALELKPSHHDLASYPGHARVMCQIGG